MGLLLGRLHADAHGSRGDQSRRGASGAGYTPMNMDYVVNSQEGGAGGAGYTPMHMDHGVSSQDGGGGLVGQATRRCTWR